jgi:hypothetical protein
VTSFSVTIFEAAAGDLFTSDAGVRAGNFVTIPIRRLHPAQQTAKSG